MKKHILLAGALLCAAISFASAAGNKLEVNEPEIKSVSEDTIKFENYTGPHSKIDSLSTIQSIGSGLGKQVAADLNKSGTYKNTAKYSVIHAVDENESGKFDADIILINSSATVDHIKNLRRIIASYLKSAYGYEDKDASTVATFVTVYNAVYRNNLSYFESKYKSVVTSNLSKEKCGLSTKWSDWPGNSQIVIPLGDLTSNISAVDTSVISDKKVVESMQEEDDKGVDERKNMVDIKEREAEKATEKAQTAAKTASTETKKLEEQKTAQKAAEKKAEETKKAAAADPTNVKKQEAAKEAEKKAEEEAQKTEEQEKVVEEAKQEAQEAQQIADKKQNEAQSERTEIAKDQQEIIKEQIKEAKDAATGNSVIGLKITDSENQLSAMVRVNTEDGSTIRESPVTVVRGRTILPVQDAVLDNAADTLSTITDGALDIDTTLLYMAICGENTNNGTVKLCLLDAYKMEIQKESKETVAEDSVLVNNGTSYYCVIENDGKWVVGKYDKSLNLLLKSPVAVASGTPIIVTDKGLVVTASNGVTTLLKLVDLTAVNESKSSSASPAIPAAEDAK